MTDRYHGTYVPGRSATFNNPNRSSMPSSIGYGSHYAGDMHAIPSGRHHTSTPRGHSTVTSNGVPTTTRTYAVTQDSRHRPSVVPREAGGRARRSTLESSSRPPVIVTTTQSGLQQPQTTTHHHQAAHSPVRHAARVSDGHLYAQPASTVRSRSTAAPHRRSHEADDYSRGRDRERERTDAALAARDAEVYRSSRPSVLYPSDPRHSSAAVDYNDDDFSYTNAGELARYDLDHTRPSKHRRRESLDRAYHRPNVNYNTDSRSFNVNSSADLNRNYTKSTSRPYDGYTRGGPPPSTRGFDRLDRSFDSAREAPVHAAPVPPSPTLPRSREPESQRERPVSMYQEATPRSSHHDDYYRTREDDRTTRELRDRERESERTHEPSFHDESIKSRGFGIRTGPADDERRERRRESWRDDPRKRSDDEVAREGDMERERRRRSRLDDKGDPRRRSDEDLPDGRERRRRSRLGERDEPRKRSDESLTRDYDSERHRRGNEESRDRRDSRRDAGEDRTRLRDKIASGVGVAAAAVGLAGSGKESDADEPKRRRSPTDDREKRSDDKEHRHAERTKEREHDRDRHSPRDDAELRDRHRRDAEARLGGEAVASGSESDAARRAPRRHRQSNTFDPNDASDISKLREQLADRREPAEQSSPPREASVERPRPKALPDSRSSGGFNPNDAGDITKLREQLASMDTSDREREKEVVRQPEPVESRASRADSPPQERRSRDESRTGRELTLVDSDEKTVRVVSPPRDKNDGKPIKGILKQPSARFPEEQNFVREGAAPHKDDKKAKEVPPGAKWTKISRKIVNPEALTVGKERFEERDDFVIVLRVLSKEEIQAYAAATQVLRERRYNRDAGDVEKNDKQDDDRDDDESRHRRRSRRHRDEDYETEDKDHDRERRRRHRRDDDDDYEIERGHRRERSTTEA